MTAAQRVLAVIRAGADLQVVVHHRPRPERTPVLVVAAYDATIYTVTITGGAEIWPEPWERDASHPEGIAAAGTGAQSKDKVESWLHHQVCAGALEQAQAGDTSGTLTTSVPIGAVDGSTLKASLGRRAQAAQRHRDGPAK